MPRQRQQSALEDAADLFGWLFRHLPPWISIPLAAAAYFVVSAGFNHLFKVKGFEEVGKAVGRVLGGAAAVAVLLGGLQGFLHRRQKARFLREHVTLEWVNGLTWQEFEALVAEIFKARGYRVEHLGGSGPDGGIDLRLTREGSTTLVQCKRWKVFKIGVRPIREFFGVMAAEKVQRGIIPNWRLNAY